MVKIVVFILENVKKMSKVRIGSEGIEPPTTSL
jgi:hypothetical protein